MYTTDFNILVISSFVCNNMSLGFFFRLNLGHSKLVRFLAKTQPTYSKEIGLLESILNFKKRLNLSENDFLLKILFFAGLTLFDDYF